MNSRNKGANGEHQTTPRFQRGDIVSALHRGQPIGGIAVVRDSCRRFCLADEWPQDITTHEPMPLFDDVDQFRLIRRAQL